MSFGLSEKIDVANWADKADIAGVTNGCGRISCQAFSKDLIVHTIYGLGPQEPSESPLRDPQPPKGANRWMAKPPLGGWGSF